MPEDEQFAWPGGWDGPLAPARLRAGGVAMECTVWVEVTREDIETADALCDPVFFALKRHPDIWEEMVTIPQC